MSGFTAMPDGAWPHLYDAVRAYYASREKPEDRAWPEEVAVVHLRWMMGERRVGRMKASAWPTVRDLQKEWGWLTKKGKPAVDRVSEFLSKEHTVEVERGGERVLVTCLHWQDGHRVAPLEELRGDRIMGANLPGARRKPDGNPTEADGNPTGDTGERQESDHVSDGNRRKPDGNPTPRASLPHASTVPPIHSDGVCPAPATPPTDDLTRRSHAGPLTTSSAGRPDAGLPPEPSQEPRCSPSTPTADSQPIPTSQPTSHGPLPSSSGRSPTSTTTPTATPAAPPRGPTGTAAPVAGPTSTPPAVAPPTARTGTPNAASARPAGGSAPTSSRAAPGPDRPTLTADGREIPPDHPALGIPMALARRLIEVSFIPTPARLLGLTVDELRLAPGMGKQRAEHIRDLVADAGFPLGCVAVEPAPVARGSPPGRAPPRQRGPSTAEALAELAELEAQGRGDPPPRPNAINVPFEVLQ